MTDSFFNRVGADETADYQAQIDARLKQENTGVYHECQRDHYSFLPALNNLMQGKEALTTTELYEIAASVPPTLTDDDKMDWRADSSTPLLSLLHSTEWGDYSTHVLRAALASRNKKVVWKDSSVSVSRLQRIMALFRDKFVGILLNFGAETRRHWVAIRMVHGVWYNLDSSLEKPRSLPDREQDLKEEILSASGEWGRMAFVLDYAVADDVKYSSLRDLALSEPNSHVQLVVPRSQSSSTAVSKCSKETNIIKALFKRLGNGVRSKMRR